MEPPSRAELPEKFEPERLQLSSDQRAAALAGDDPRSLLAVALDSGEAGPPLLANIAELESAPPEVRATALLELATVAAAPYSKLFTRSLRSPSEAIQLAAIGGLNMLDFSEIPHDEVLKALARLGPDAKSAALSMLSRVFEEGKKLDYDLRVRVSETVVKHRALDDHSLIGALAIAPTVDRAGALSIERHDHDGALSTPESE